MSDIVEQLRYAADDTDAVNNASVAYLLEHAAGEIELLRGYRDAAEADAAVARLLVDRLRLTDAEREAIGWAGHALCVGWNDLDAADKQRSRDAAVTLRALFERLGQPAK